MRLFKLAAILFLFLSVTTPSAVGAQPFDRELLILSSLVPDDCLGNIRGLSDTNIFARSPVQLATEKADARTRQILEAINPPPPPAPGGGPDFNMLARRYQVPQNVIEASSKAAGIAGPNIAWNFATRFSKAMGSQIAGGKSVEDAMRDIFPDCVDTQEILQRAIDMANVEEATTRIPASSNGHYYAKPVLDGVELTMMVDTGASVVLLTQKDAMAVGIDTGSLTYDTPFALASGKALYAETSVGNLIFAGLNFKNFAVYVSPTTGDNATSLLGMSVLRAFRSIQFANGELLISN